MSKLREIREKARNCFGLGDEDVRTLLSALDSQEEELRATLRDLDLAVEDRDTIRDSLETLVKELHKKEKAVEAWQLLRERAVDAAVSAEDRAKTAEALKAALAQQVANNDEGLRIRVRLAAEVTDLRGVLRQVCDLAEGARRDR